VKVEDWQTMNLSEHFALSEFLFSQTAVRRGIDNTPNAGVIKNLAALCENVLEPLRGAANAPIRISSGYRSPGLNKAVGGSATSQHCFGEAVDLSCPGMSITDLTRLLHSLNLPVDQVIHEGTWLHISHKRKGENRGQWLKATFTNGRAKYSQLDLL
jgi:zinc D-Ala-D-Ala carboxypeptidase